MGIFSFLSFAAIFLANVDESVGVEVQISQGRILGKSGVSRNGNEFFSFLGIPYGVVRQRFMESTPAPSWEGVKDTSMFGKGCLSADDCLHINVFTPSLSQNESAPLAVMFWIHGGAFQFGSAADYGAEYFMDEGIILVSTNYRLGVYGFFSLDIDEAPGNQGMKDLVLALKWTKENIGFFNGDPNRVTIFGESAGGVSVSLMVLSPLTKGLFQGAISQSGTALCPWAFRTDVKQESRKLALRLGCDGTDEQVLECMLKVSSYQLWFARGSNILPDNSFVKPMSFVPTIERRAPSSQSTILLNKTPLEALQKGQFQDVPYIIGNNRYETGLAGFIMNMLSNETVRDWLPYFGPRSFGYLGRPDADKISAGIQKTYFEGVQPKDSQAFIAKVTDDRAFFLATRLFGSLHSARNPVYLYFFDLPGYATLVPYVTSNTPQHGDELVYQFPLTKPPYWGAYPIPKGHPLYRFSSDFVRLWVDFAKNGKPGSIWNSGEIKWERMNADSPKWLHINQTEATFQEETPSFQRRMNFWTKFYYSS